MSIVHASLAPSALPGGVFGVRSGVNWRERSGPGTFNSDPYLKLLNLILRGELGARELYQTYSLKICDSPSHESIADSHQRAGKTIQSLILYHRGLPEFEGFNLRSEIPLVTLNLAAFMPGRLCKVTALKSCVRMERWLMAAYRRTLKVASVRDCAILTELLNNARSNLKTLKNSC